LTASIGALISKRKSYKRQLSLYVRNKKRYFDLVAKLTLPSELEESSDTNPKRDQKKSLVINLYRLLRSISLSSNILENSKEDK
jgi:hypothetical protein